MRQWLPSSKIWEKKWAILLSVANTLAYATLFELSRPPQIEGIFREFSVDFYTPLAPRAALALNTPAFAVAASMAQLLGTLELSVIWGLGLLPAGALWYFIGLWIDRFQMPPRPISRHSWREPTRLVASSVLGLLLLFMAVTWPQALVTLHTGGIWNSFEVIAAVVVWPAFLGLVSIRTIWKGVY